MREHAVALRDGRGSLSTSSVSYLRTTAFRGCERPGLPTNEPEPGELVESPSLRLAKGQPDICQSRPRRSLALPHFISATSTEASLSASNTTDSIAGCFPWTSPILERSVCMT